MLRVYHSNRLDVLEALMEFIVERQRLDDPFMPEMVLVQSTGMAQWLQMTLAQRFGIAANIEFPLPASFIWDMFVRVLKDIPGESAFSKQSMSWKLMTLLPQRLNDEAFTLLRHYLHDDSDKRKLFQLAARVADLYDQYLVYRPEWLMRWEADQRVDGLGDAQEWQAPLWKALVEYTAELGQPLWHRANLYQRFISALEAAEQPPAGLPSRVFICGISALPPVYLQALQALGKHMSMYMFSSLTRAATTGATLKIRHFWQSCSPASAATTAKRRESCPCFAIRNRLRGYSTMPGNRMSAIRCWPPGASWGATIFTCWRVLSAMKSWTPLSISRRITCCIIFRRIFSNCVMRRWPGAAPRSLPTAAASGCWRRTTAA